MSDSFPAAVEQKAREFVAALQASVKVRRYAEAPRCLSGGKTLLILVVESPSGLTRHNYLPCVTA